MTCSPSLLSERETTVDQLVLQGKQLLSDSSYYGEIVRTAKDRLEQYSYLNSKNRMEALISDIKKDAWQYEEIPYSPCGKYGRSCVFCTAQFQTIKKKYPESHITFVTAWGFKDKYGVWGKRNQGGFSISLMMTNPHIDTLVHFHDNVTDLNGALCREGGVIIPRTWSRQYYEKQKSSQSMTANFLGSLILGFFKTKIP